MKWFTRPRQRCLGLLAVVALVLALSACGAPANATNSGAPASNPVKSQPQQYQPSHSGATTQNSGSNSTTNNGSNNAANADQQIQSLLHQLDGAHNDVNNADAGASQDGGQP